MNQHLLCLLSAAWLSAVATTQHAPCTGTLRDPTGAPIAAAKVTFCQEPSQTFGLAPDRVEVATDAAGAFAAPLLLGSPYAVWAIGPADPRGARWVTGVSMQAAAGKALDLIAVRRARPHAVALRGVTPWRDHVPPALRVLVDGNYALDFDRPLRGDGTLELGPWPGHEVEFALVDDKRQLLCRVGPIAEDAGEVVFPPLRTVEVVAVDTKGAPIEGVEVALCPDTWRPGYGDRDPLPPMESQSWRVVARTDARGRAILPLAWSNESRDTDYTFAATAEGHVVSFAGILAGKPVMTSENEGVPFQFVMSPSRQRHVAVLGNASVPRGFVALLSNCPFTAGSGWLTHLASGALVDGGVHLPAADRPIRSRCLVRLAASTGAPARVCIGEAQDEQDATVDLRRLTPRTLVVQDAAGQPAPFAQVAIVHRFGDQLNLAGDYLFEHDRCVTDANGKVELLSSAVTWDIVAVTDSGLGWSRIEPDDARQTVPVNLLTVGCARFRVVDDQGHPVADARLDRNGVGPWIGSPDLLMQEVARQLASSQRSDHDGMLVVPMPYGEFREVRIVHGNLKSWRQTVRPGEQVIAVELH